MDSLGCVAFSNPEEIKFNKYPILDLGDTIKACKGVPVTLYAGNSGASYLWSDSSKENFLNILHDGVYSIKVNYGNCFSFDTVCIIFLGASHKFIPNLITPNLD